MAATLGVAPDRFLTAYQIHSPDVVTVTSRGRSENRPRVDAMVTKMPGLALGISTADCGPVLFADGEARVIGAAHAGWRGALHRRAGSDHRGDGEAWRQARRASWPRSAR